MTTLDEHAPATAIGLDAPDLPGIPQPDELWAAVRGRVLDDPAVWPAMAADGHWLSDRLWEHWAARLEAAGVTPDRLAAIVAGYHQELWLWLMGERTWRHALSGLAGRVARRAPG